MGAIGTDRGRDDDRQRGADAKRHPHLQGDAGEPETFIEDRDQDSAAADPEHAGEKARQRADNNQQQCQFDQLGNLEPRHRHPVISPACAFLNRASGIPAISGCRPVNSHNCKAHL